VRSGIVVLACALALAPAWAEVVAQADFNDGTMGPFKSGQYGKGGYLCEVVEGLGTDGSACLRLVNSDPGSGAALVGQLAYERGHTYTMTFRARCEGDGATVNCFLDAGDYRNKFPTTYSPPFELTEEWRECRFEQLHLQGRGYVTNIVNRTKATTPVLIDDVVIARSEGRTAINWAAAKWKSIPTADSLFEGYQAGALNDGFQAYAGGDYSRRSVATSDGPGPHWLAVTFPAERAVSRVVIYWNAERQQIFSSRSFEVQLLQSEQWVTVADGGESEPTHVSVAEFDETQAGGVRIYQPEGGGSGARSNILWVSEVEAY
jgi:hypothetical protein